MQAKVISARRLTEAYLDEHGGALSYQKKTYLRMVRPKQRIDCCGVPRPCPWVSCKWHLYLDVNDDTGAIKLNFPDVEVWEMEHSCALDVADAGPRPLEQVARLMNLTRERARQMSGVALDLVERRARRRGLDKQLDSYDAPPVNDVGAMAEAVEAAPAADCRWCTLVETHGYVARRRHRWAIANAASMGCVGCQDNRGDTRLVA